MSIFFFFFKSLSSLFLVSSKLSLHFTSLFLPLSLFLSLSVAILLKDDYFVQGAGLPGRFKAEKVEFHWGQSNGSDGSEHSINGRRFPVEVRVLPQIRESQSGLCCIQQITSLKYLYSIRIYITALLNSPV